MPCLAPGRCSVFVRRYEGAGEQGAHTPPLRAELASCLLQWVGATTTVYAGGFTFCSGTSLWQGEARYMDVASGWGGNRASPNSESVA